MEAGSLGTACGRDSTNHICVVQWELQTLKPRFLTGEHTDGPGAGGGAGCLWSPWGGVHMKMLCGLGPPKP